MDFYGPLPSGEKLLVVIDNFSRFPIVELMKSTTASNVISRLDKMFSIYGYPDRIRSDNGPPLKSHKIKEYFRQRGIHHKMITPLWPRRNGIVESFMKNINKSIRTSLIDNRPWRQALSSMLFSYRNTTHATTSYKPIFLFFNRNIRTGLPSIPEKSQHYDSVLINQRNRYESVVRNNPKENLNDSIKINDTVLLKRERKDNNFQSNFIMNHIS